jgi:hypothetical protein
MSTESTMRIKSAKVQAKERLDAAKRIYDRVYLHWSRNRTETNLQALEKAGKAVRDAESTLSAASMDLKYNHGRMPTVRIGEEPSA